MKFTILTLGCKVNQYDSGALSGIMSAAGFEPALSEGESDIFIVNSCTVTENSDKKALHVVSRLKKQYPASVVVLTGCYPQAFPLEAELSAADIVTGASARSAIPSQINGFLSTGRRVSAVLPQTARFEELAPVAETDKTRAYVKIEDGCDRFCSYCIIPTARGRVRSRSLENIEREVALQADAGHKEIVLVGINLSCYGKDLGLQLCDAIEAAAKNEKILRVRLSSLEPELLTPDVIARMAKTEKLCPHFHLSLQSGSDATLKRMNRHYTSAEYAEIVDNLRRAFPNCAITTDIMVGFAGETEEEFAESLAFAEKIGFARIHVFTYSVREGTAAAKRTDFVHEDVKRERYNRMSALGEALRERFYKSQLSTEHKLLVEKRISPDFINGYTENYTPVRVYGSKAKRHDLICVRITGSKDEKCLADEL